MFFFFVIIRTNEENYKKLRYVFFKLKRLAKKINPCSIQLINQLKRLNK
jgi:hypothetical protein